MAESEEELKSLLMKIKVESEKVGLKPTFRKRKSWHLVPPLHGKYVLEMKPRNTVNRIQSLESIIALPHAHRDLISVVPGRSSGFPSSV